MTRARSNRPADQRPAAERMAAGPRRAHSRPVARTVGVATLLALVVACGGSDRPSDDAWRETWERQRILVPDADTIVAGGAEFCGELVGELRVELAELRPTPTEALDDPVDDWIAHAENIAFDCPDDRADLANRLRTLDLIAAEIEAGLAADARS